MFQTILFTRIRVTAKELMIESGEDNSEIATVAFLESYQRPDKGMSGASRSKTKNSVSNRVA